MPLLGRKDLAPCTSSRTPRPTRHNGSQKASSGVAVTIDDLPAELFLDVFTLCSPGAIFNLISVSPKALAVFRAYRPDLIRSLIVELRDLLGFPKVDPKDHAAVLRLLPYESPEELISDVSLVDVPFIEEVFGLRLDFAFLPFSNPTRPPAEDVMEDIIQGGLLSRRCPAAWLSSSFPASLPDLDVLFDLARGVELPFSCHKNSRLLLAPTSPLNPHWVCRSWHNTMIYMLALGQRSLSEDRDHDPLWEWMPRSSHEFYSGGRTHRMFLFFHRLSDLQIRMYDPAGARKRALD
ncbi:hypothetical protein GE09DRAFT_1285819 [Coniochaeta sp. 2T2.1]|nr:hypothetical protein GE09DRAFT_1285819 [Coniochaeta sp. 2T2.1]